jgi:murein DD-endopeptidase MepM/ murein hydrolase activator NlpD
MSSPKEIINQAATQYGIDPKILYGLWGAESSFSTTGERSSAGAEGPFQFLPSTAKGMGVDPHDFHSAAFGAAKYLSQYKNRGVSGMLSAYNAGPAGGLQPDYVNSVLSHAKGYGGSAGLLSAAQRRAGAAAGIAPVVPEAATAPAPPKEPNPIDAITAIRTGNLNPQIDKNWKLLKSLFDTQTPISQPPTGEPPAIPLPGEEPRSRQRQGAPASGGYPLGRTGKVIGTPYSGTHTIGNWESDNAIDLAVPKGTPVYAVGPGTIGSQIGSLGAAAGSRFAGERLHLVTPGNEWYYAHLSKIVVKAGQRVKAGQILGYSGEANGVQHLHIASKNGSPLGLTKKTR